MKPYRTVLFVPAHKTSWYDKAADSGADAVCFDLEDSVPDHLKPEARERGRRRRPSASRESTRRWGMFVRPNSLGTGLTGLDLEATVAPGLTGIFAPKVDDGGRRDQVRHPARPLRGPRRGQRAGVHHPGRDDPRDPELRGDRRRVAPGRRDDRADRRARRHREGGGLRVDARGLGVAGPPDQDPAGHARPPNATRSPRCGSGSTTSRAARRSPPAAARWASAARSSCTPPMCRS